MVMTIVALACTGCVTKSYKLAPKSTPPAVALNLANAPARPATESEAAGAASVVAAAPVPEVTLRSVIVYRGPGSWKRDALWDEYVVAIRNRGIGPLMVRAAGLHAANAEPLPPGDDPWVLEKASKQWWQANAVRQTGTYLALGAGTAAGASTMLAMAYGSILGGASSGTVAAATVGAATFVALPLVAGGTIFMNVHRKHQVQEEFARRRLVLPVTVAPGQVVEGSLFFRTTPSPRRLDLRYKADGPVNDTSIDLAPLAGLHVKDTSAEKPKSGNSE